MQKRIFLIPKRRSTCKNTSTTTKPVVARTTFFSFLAAFHHKISILTYALLGVYFLLWLPSLFRFIPLTVQSDSMSPTFSRGDIIYYRPTENTENSVEQLQEGTIVSFKISDQVVVSHRIYQLNPDRSFETKGDNNTDSDKNKVQFSEVLGLVTPVVVPYLGYYVDFINTHLRLCLIICALVFILELFTRNYTPAAGRTQEKIYHEKIPQR